MSKIVNQTTTPNPFTYWTDKSVTANLAIGQPMAVRSLLCGEEGSLLDVYGTGEYEFDKFAVKLYLHRGTASGVTIRYGKNLIDLEDEVDYTDSYTGVVPFWTGSEGDEEVTVVGNPVLSGHSSYGDRDIVIPLDLSSEFEDAPTQVALMARAEAILADSDAWLPSRTLKVDFVQLWQTEEYKNFAPLQRVHLCDTVGVLYPALGVVVNGIKVIETTYNVLLNRYDEMILGDPPASYAQAISESVKIDLSRYAKTADISALQKALDDMAADLEAQIDGKIETWTQSTPPSAAWTTAEVQAEHDGDLWLYTGMAETSVVNVTIRPQGVYQWNATTGKWTAYSSTSANLFDLADGKTTIFYGDPSGTYTAKTGDYLVNPSDGKSYRWAGQWVLVTDYVSAIANLQTALECQIDNKVETFYQSTDPSTNWTAAEKTAHRGDLWFNTSTGKTYQYSGSGWQEMTANPPQSVFNTINGKANIFLGSTTPTGASEGDLWFQSASEPILTYVNGQWTRYNMYTDDSAFDTWRLNTFATTIANINSDIADLQEQVDGNITSWFYTVDPSMSLPPVTVDPQNPDSTGWDTDAKKDAHLGDLYYNTTNGYTFRFVYQNGAYQWVRVQDSDVARALETAQNALDVADNKRRVFVTTPTPPYDVGDLWTQGENGDLMRCATARAEGEPYDVTADFVLAAESLTDFIATTYADDLSALQTQIDAKIETWAQSTNPASAWSTAAARAEHNGDLWLYTGLTDLTVGSVTIKPQGVYQYNGSSWVAYSSTTDNLFDLADGKSTIYYGSPSTSRTGVNTGDYLVDPSDGCTYRWSGTAWVKQTDYQAAISSVQSALETAITNATEKITGGQGGHVLINHDANGKPQEILIMNTEDVNTATKIWRWNLGGLGYSKTGYNGTFGTAITQDGEIVADYITAGTLTANLIKAGILSDTSGKNSWNMDTGDMVLRKATFYGTDDEVITTIGDTLYMRNTEPQTDMRFIHLSDTLSSSSSQHFAVYADGLMWWKSGSNPTGLDYDGVGLVVQNGYLDLESQNGTVVNLDKGDISAEDIYAESLGGWSGMTATIRYANLAATVTGNTPSVSDNSTRIATTAFVKSQGYATQSWVGQQGYITSAALSGYATQTWVGQQGYLTDADMSGYATKTWVSDSYAAKTWVTSNYAPKSHAASDTTYGAGTGALYGHLKLSDSTTSTSSVSGGVAATPKGVKDALDAAKSYADGLAPSGVTGYETNDDLSIYPQKTGDTYQYATEVFSSRYRRTYTNGVYKSATSASDTPPTMFVTPYRIIQMTIPGISIGSGDYVTLNDEIEALDRKYDGFAWIPIAVVGFQLTGTRNTYCIVSELRITQSGTYNTYYLNYKIRNTYSGAATITLHVDILTSPL
jgi:phage minor structural protein